MFSLRGLVRLTEALDGVTVSNPTAFTSPYAERPSPAGSIRSAESAAPVSPPQRAGEPTAAGDALRISTQRAHLTAAFGPVLSPSTLLNPARSVDAVQKLSRYLSTDEGLNADYVVGLGFVLRDTRTNGVGFVALPVSGTTTAGGETALAVPAVAVDRIRSAFRKDGVAGLAATGAQRP